MGVVWPRLFWATTHRADHDRGPHRGHVSLGVLPPVFGRYQPAFVAVADAHASNPGTSRLGSKSEMCTINLVTPRTWHQPHTTVVLPSDPNQST